MSGHTASARIIKKPCPARIGVGYIDDCLMLTQNYASYYYYTTIQPPVQTNVFLVQLSLRTLGPDALPSVGY